MIDGSDPNMTYWRWFSGIYTGRISEDPQPYDLASIYAARYREYDPYVIYLRVLWERYGDELNQELESDPRLRLNTFQNDGMWRAQRLLRDRHGVLITDGVGLGKTYRQAPNCRTWPFSKFDSTVPESYCKLRPDLKAGSVSPPSRR